jgi:hypothetical protein
MLMNIFIALFILNLDESGVVRHAMATSMGSEDTAKSCLDLVALLRQNKVSQLRLMATSLDSAKSCLDLVALLRQNKVSTVVLLPNKYSCVRGLVRSILHVGFYNLS